MKTLKPTSPCACHSGQPYGECCAPYHRAEREPPDAEAMMRSRYSAFALGHVIYLYDTMHPDHEDRRRPRAQTLRELREGCESFRYMGLNVLEHAGPDAHGIARVLFIAKIFERGRDRSFVELSEFVHDGKGWRYRVGHTLPLKLLKDKLASLTIATFPASVPTSLDR